MKNAGVIKLRKVGFMIGRFMPLHNGHIELINSAAKQVDELIVLVGSMGVINERNPFKIQDRLRMLNECTDFWEKDKITFIPIFDLTNEDDSNETWGNYLYDLMKKITNKEKFTYFTSESETKIKEWFGENQNIEVVSFTRFSDISATKVRQSICGNWGYFIENCPESAIELVERIERCGEITQLMKFMKPKTK